MISFVKGKTEIPLDRLYKRYSRRLFSSIYLNPIFLTLFGLHSSIMRPDIHVLYPGQIGSPYTISFMTLTED